MIRPDFPMTSDNPLRSIADWIPQSRKILEDWQDLHKTLRSLLGYKHDKASYMREWRKRRAEHVAQYRHEYSKREHVVMSKRLRDRNYYHRAVKVDPLKLAKHRSSSEAWRMAHPEKSAAAAAKRRAKDPQRFNEISKNCYRRKSEEERKAIYQSRREYQKEYRQKNADRLREKNKLRYAAKDKEELRKQSRQRYTEKKAEYIARAEERIRKLSERGSHTQEDIDRLYEAQKHKCAACSAPITVRSRRAKYGYEVDHVQPVALGGSNNPENLQLLCRSCNRTKHSMSPEKWAKRIGKLFV